MGLKREQLCSNHDLGVPTVTAQQDCRRCRPLQTLDALEIEDAGEIRRATQGSAFISLLRGQNPLRSHSGVQPVKAMEVHEAIEIEQQNPTLDK
jgi:hypothetical protein